MSLFKKKQPPLDDLPEDGNWKICRGENEGRPMFVRVNESAQPFAGHPQLSTRLGIAVPLVDPDENGLPTEAEAEQLAEIEDQLVEAVGKQGIVVLVITTSGMREFVTYLQLPQQAEKIVERVQNVTGTHEIQHYAEADPGWEVFGQFA